MKTIKINKKGAGKWADPDTNVPQIEVEEGDEVTVSNALADLLLPNCGKDITAELAKAADKAAAKQKDEDDAAVEEQKVAELKAQAEALISSLKLSDEDINLGLDSEGLEALVKDLTAQQDIKVAEALVAAEAAEKQAADDKKKAAAKKTPATKDKKAAESK